MTIVLGVVTISLYIENYKDNYHILETLIQDTIESYDVEMKTLRTLKFRKKAL